MTTTTWKAWRAGWTGLVLWLVLTAAPVAAQSYAPNHLADVQHVDAACPGLILQDHAFTNAVVLYLEQRYPSEGWGRNAKRGNSDDPSHDAIWYPTSASPLAGAVIDIIVAAGSPGASPAWIDQTAATIAAGTTGGYIRPSGELPACLTGDPSAPGPGPSEPVQPAPAVDLAPVLAALAVIQRDVSEIKARDQSQPIDDAALDAFLRDMVGDGPDGDGPLPPHVTDIKQRLDVIRQLLEQLVAWLRGRAILRY